VIERLLNVIKHANNKQIVVIGDIIADEFIYGQLSRMSREAPVLILKYDSSTVLPGGAGNTAANVAALGGRARLVGLVGRHDIDRQLVRSLPKGVDCSGLVRPQGYQATLKTRILAGGLHSSRQQVVRIDRETQIPKDSRTQLDFERAVRKSLVGCDAVLLSDYGSGLVTPKLVSTIKKFLKSSRRRNPIPIVADSRYKLLRYRGLTACTPNESEVEQMLNVSVGNDPRKLEKAGREILRRNRFKGLVLTRGSRGMAVFVPGRRTVHIPIFGTDEVADVTGAGDTVIATVTLALAAGASLYEAAHLANCAGGLVVMKRGTATVSVVELRNAIQDNLLK